MKYLFSLLAQGFILFSFLGSHACADNQMPRKTLRNIPEASTLSIDPTVWEPKPNQNGFAWIRDPFLFKTPANTYIMSGTKKYILEYPSNGPGALLPQNATSYATTLYSPDGKRLLRKAGFHEWGKVFFNSSYGLLMLTSLPAATGGDYNTGDVNKFGKRNFLVFDPDRTGPKTAHGFPLAWKMHSNAPLLPQTYDARPFQDGNLWYLTHDARLDEAKKTTCLISRTLSKDLSLGEPNVLLCPGKEVASAVDQTRWDRDRPLPSERRFKDGGGLLEGSWLYRSANGTYYVFYSSGSYDNDHNYGGFIATCSSPLGPCHKVMNASKTDVRPFVAGISAHYYQIGRPYPVINNKNEITDIIFHARRKGTKQDSILRCTNFSPTLITNFIAGGPGCTFDTSHF